MLAGDGRNTVEMAEGVPDAKSDRIYEAVTVPIGSMRAIEPPGPTQESSTDKAPPVTSAVERPAPMEPRTETPSSAESTSAEAKSDGPAPAEEPATAAAPTTDPVNDDVERTILPQDRIRAATEAVLRIGRDLREQLLAARTAMTRQPPWVPLAVAGSGLAVVVVILILLASLSKHQAETTTETAAGPAPSVEPSVAAPVMPAPEPSASTLPPPPAPSPPPPTACRVSSPSNVLAPAASIVAGLEVRPIGESEFLVGFATGDQDAVALRFDGTAATVATTAAKATIHTRSGIRRVTPVISPKGALGAQVDIEAKNDAIGGRRTVLVDPQIQVGAAGDSLVWARAGGAPAGKLWPLEGDGDVQALRGATDSSGDGTALALAFRKGSAIDLGLATTARGELGTAGDLLRIDSLGGGVGSPAVAMNDGVILAAWADRASADGPWSLRWIHLRSGQAPGRPEMFSPPPGGKGEQAMSPSVVALPGKRFLLVWTEGPPSGHDVRAVTLSEEGEFIGAPLDISSPGSNAGQGQASVTAGGRGIVAFFESGEAGFRVAATPIQCEL